MRIRGFAAAIASIIAVFVLATPNSTAEPECNHLWYCWFEDVNYGGAICGSDVNDSNYADNYVYDRRGAAVNCNNMASSYVNNGTGTYHCIRAFDNANYSKQLWLTWGAVGQSTPSNKSAWVGGADNDKATSHNWNSNC